MIVLIEGVDFTGKTTIAQMLKKHIDSISDDGCVYFHNPEGLNDESRELYDKIKNTKDQTLKDIYLLQSHYLNQKKINKLAKTTNVVVDRSIFTYCMYNMNGDDDSVISLTEHLFDFPKYHFDYAIGLNADIEELQRRAKNRGHNDVLDDYFLKHLVSIKRHMDNFEYTTVFDSDVRLCYDTTNLTTHGVYSKILNDMGLYEKRA